MNGRVRVLLGIALVLCGLAFALLPKTWIEDALGFEPDAGNGLVELLLALLPLLVGILLLTAPLMLKVGRHVMRERSTRQGL
jgi:hypothetical protein